jgi:alpha-aminoadipate carrier protein LysW
MCVFTQLPNVLNVFRRIFVVPLATCPECEAEIHVDEDVDKGETLHCEECEAKLEVVGLDPIELDTVMDAEDDDDDDEEDDY